MKKPTRRPFGTRRGRPKKIVSSLDLGTPELIQKRGECLTMEVIDYFYEKGIISQEEHRCSLHFRWLFTLRFGCPTVHALDPSDMGSGALSPRDNEAKAAYEEKYKTAAEHLRKHGLLDTVLRIVIYNVFPISTSSSSSASTARTFNKSSKEIELLREGLRLLNHLWQRRSSLSATYRNDAITPLH